MHQITSPQHQIRIWKDPRPHPPTPSSSTSTNLRTPQHRSTITTTPKHYDPPPLLHHKIELFDIRKIVRTRLHGSAQYLEYLVEADASGLQDVVRSALSDFEEAPPRSASPFSLSVPSTIRTWLPGPLFQAAFPALVKSFHSGNGTPMVPLASDVIDLTESDDEVELSDVELEVTGCHSDTDSIIDLVSDSD
ncbi:hypothetical protein BD410DRAFT_837340 [Rickenella mellea]|uniref:Uncharacterized protein n=1 Tax=Rickenella mellea TaxID=50990 RepID=A0A4Y7QBP3_9AGAM|nr:hypothetical protein BD410DRAFT_837340 [Rickenella mellea]